MPYKLNPFTGELDRVDTSSGPVIPSGTQTATATVIIENLVAGNNNVNHNIALLGGGEVVNVQVQNNALKIVETTITLTDGNNLNIYLAGANLNNAKIYITYKLL